MIIPILIIILSWLLNAAMDAIDHGKGAQTLNLLWHTLKWLSYALPFGYIIFTTTTTPLLTIIIMIPLLWIIWEITYRYLRSIDFHRWDK